MNVNLLPTYFCNFRCHYCCWTPEQLSDPKTISLSDAKQRLDEIPGDIDVVDIYGGEVAVLSEDYMYGLLDLCYARGAKAINVVTNGSSLPSWLWAPNLTIGFSWDYKCREDYKKVYENMSLFNRTFSINTVVTKCFLKQDLDKMIEMLNGLKHLYCWELKPYSPNLGNNLGLTNKEFEDTVMKVIEKRALLRPDITFINQDIQLEKAVRGTANPKVICDTIFILPTGKFGDFGYDGTGLEKFASFEDFNSWVAWKSARRDEIRGNTFCSKCAYLGKCMSENMREVKHIDKDSCDGFIDLITWYKSYDRTV